MIYKPAAVTPVGTTAVLNTVAFVNGGDTRPAQPALARAGVRDNATGGVLHRRRQPLQVARARACDRAGRRRRPGQLQRSCARTRPPRWSTGWPPTRPAPATRTSCIVGDLNSYAKEDPIATLEAAGFTNLIDESVGADAYSYVFDGQWGYLDHALGSPIRLAR